MIAQHFCTRARRGTFLASGLQLSILLVQLQIKSVRNGAD
jgi:hypothetical protein